MHSEVPKKSKYLLKQSKLRVRQAGVKIPEKTISEAKAPVGLRQRQDKKIRLGSKTTRIKKLTRENAGTLDMKHKTNWQRLTQSTGLKYTRQGETKTHR